VIQFLALGMKCILNFACFGVWHIYFEYTYFFGLNMGYFSVCRNLDKCFLSRDWCFVCFGATVLCFGVPLRPTKCKI